VNRDWPTSLFSESPKREERREEKEDKKCCGFLQDWKIFESGKEENFPFGAGSH
jgi:hypothetical protein